MPVPEMAAVADGTPTVLQVMSDIQGRLDHLESAFGLLGSLPGPAADHLLVVGDLVDNGTEEQYAELMPVLRRHEPVGGSTFLIGNHEFYNDLHDPDGNRASLSRFLRRTGGSRVYGSRTVGRAHLVWLGTVNGDRDAPVDVVLGEDQLSWLATTLADLSRRHPGEPVLVFAHQPLPETVSGTRSDRPDQAPAIYGSDYAEPERLRRLLASHGRVFFCTGHTHWRVDRDDWLVPVVVPGVGAFTAVNTGAIHSSFGPDGQGGERMTDPEDHSCLRVLLDAESIRFEAYDVRAGRCVNTFSQGRVLAGSAGDGGDVAGAESFGPPLGGEDT